MCRRTTPFGYLGCPKGQYGVTQKDFWGGIHGGSVHQKPGIAVNLLVYGGLGPIYTPKIVKIFTPLQTHGKEKITVWRSRKFSLATKKRQGNL